MPELPPDPEALEQWRQMPQNSPSRGALPPMTGGTRLSKALLIGFAVLIILAVILQFRPA